VCLMTYYPSGAMPVREHLENGAKLNPDGFGWAMLIDGMSLISRRGLDAEEMITDFMAHRMARLDGHALFHSRHATDTGSTVGNCHPFPLAGDPRITVAHNGYLFEVADGETRSDSRVFAEDILPRCNLDDPAERAGLEAWLDTNKVVILSGAPALAEPVYILNGKLGVMLDDGTWHSNADYTGIAQDSTKCRACGSGSLAGGLSLPTGGELCARCVAALAARAGY